MRKPGIFVLVVLGASHGQDLGNLQVFPADNPWNWDISGFDVHPDSDAFIASIGVDIPIHPGFGTKCGIPYCIILGKKSR